MSSTNAIGKQSPFQSAARAKRIALPKLEPDATYTGTVEFTGVKAGLEAWTKKYILDRFSGTKEFFVTNQGYYDAEQGKAVKKLGANIKSGDGGMLSGVKLGSVVGDGVSFTTTKNIMGNEVELKGKIRNFERA